MYRIAVVTPYYKEDRAVLAQCHDSVLHQSYPCDHIAVADGFPSELFEAGPRTLHVKLPKGNDDNGNTPRAIGGILAEAYGYDAVAYLDADNWYEPSHIERLVAAHEKTRAPLICCKRKFFESNGVQIPITEPAEDANSHVDTSCWLVFRPAFSLLRAWLMPKVLGPVCDRIFLQRAIHDRFRITPTEDRTVCFRTQYAYHYQLAGMAVPPGMKTPRDVFKVNDYLLSKAGAREITRALGFYPTL
ncbi:MAG: glycosyltransferase family 2 protein [Rhizomicrobium sp.]